jgi:hypothetical protein
MESATLRGSAGLKVVSTTVVQTSTSDFNELVTIALQIDESKQLEADIVPLVVVPLHPPVKRESIVNELEDFTPSEGEDRRPPSEKIGVWVANGTEANIGFGTSRPIILIHVPRHSFNIRRAVESNRAQDALHVTAYVGRRSAQRDRSTRKPRFPSDHPG